MESSKYENYIRGDKDLDEDNYNIEDKDKILFTHIEDKRIKGYINKDLNVISMLNLIKIILRDVNLKI